MTVIGSRWPSEADFFYPHFCEISTIPSWAFDDIIFPSIRGSPPCVMRPGVFKGPGEHFTVDEWASEEQHQSRGATGPAISPPEIFIPLSLWSRPLRREKWWTLLPFLEWNDRGMMGIFSKDFRRRPKKGQWQIVHKLLGSYLWSHLAHMDIQYVSYHGDHTHRSILVSTPWGQLDTEANRCSNTHKRVYK